MSDALAKTMVATAALLLAVALGVLAITSRHASSTREIAVQFANAFPLIEGMDVRVDGVVAGKVSRLRVTDDGLAQATLALEDDVKPPRADAVAAVRQQDPGAESYVALEPGTSRGPLPMRNGLPTIACDTAGAGIACPRSLVAPRVDDLLNTFDDATRAAVKLMISELSRALDRRGVDINRAALQLRPALVAGSRALAEVNRQRSALKRLIADAENVTGQAAERRRALGRSIGSLDATLSVTAARAKDLDASLERLPETLARTRAVLAGLTRLGRSGRPLADALNRGAPDLVRVLDEAPGFLDDTAAFARRARPTVDLSTKFVRAATPAIESASDRLVTGAFDIAPAVARLITGLFGDESTIRALIGNAMQIMVEPGNQSGYPPEYADRRFGRATGILTCQLFGVPVKPGCLADALAALPPGRRDRSAGPVTPSARIPVRPRHPKGPAGPTGAQRPPDVLQDAIGAVKGTLGGGQPSPSTQDIQGVLDYLLGP